MIFKTETLNAALSKAVQVSSPHYLTCSVPAPAHTPCSVTGALSSDSSPSLLGAGAELSRLPEPHLGRGLPGSDAGPTGGAQPLSTAPPVRASTVDGGINGSVRWSNKLALRKKLSSHERLSSLCTVTGKTGCVPKLTA